MNTIKMLLQRQKSLVLIFLLTIVLPSLVLSIFGILTIKNEKYALEKKVLDEQQNSMMLIKRQFSNQLANLEGLLASSTQKSTSGEKDYKEIRNNLNLFINENQPVDQVFILLDNGTSFFPLLQNTPSVIEPPKFTLTALQQNIFEQAQREEFVNQDFELAVSLYAELINKVSEYNSKAQILNNLARVYKKFDDIPSAISTYKIITEQYPFSLTSSGMPLVLTAELQLIECYKMSKNNKQALENALHLFNKILVGDINLNENQFFSYTEMIDEIINELLNTKHLANKNIMQEYEALKEKYELCKNQWNTKTKIESEIIPALQEIKEQPGKETFHFSKRIAGEDFLISTIFISDMICIKWNNKKLLQEWLKPIIDNLIPSQQLNVVVTDFLGRVLMGKYQEVKDSISLTGEFEDSFPPWHIRISRVGSNSAIGIDIIQSYYFWSILTLLIILIFGTSLIIKAVNREREIISIKSDFIASVSHELKTPLTSIRALTERLLAGKVTSQEKMQEYFKIIDQDANKLTILVKNILDFSKIESGKKEYTFQVTNLTEWLNRTIDDFSKDHLNDPTEIIKHFESNIPDLAIDRDALSQCMINLLDNALKFSTKNRPIEVYLKKGSKFINILVQDHGNGISEVDLPKIFDKFYQGTPEKEQYVKGTGLGLAIVKHAIEAHSGRVEVSSIQNQGSIFTIFLPNINSNQ